MGVDVTATAKCKAVNNLKTNSYGNKRLDTVKRVEGIRSNVLQCERLHHSSDNESVRINNRFHHCKQVKTR